MGYLLALAVALAVGLPAWAIQAATGLGAWPAIGIACGAWVLLFGGYAVTHRM